MAGPILKRAGALVWLPPRGDGRSLPASDARLAAFVRAASGEWAFGPASIETLAAARKPVVLLVDARDVTLLTPTLPPLSGAMLARALPNAVEDLLLQEPASCVLALGPAVGDAGARLVAACDRQWLEQVVALFERRGLTVAAIWPAALSLPLAAGGWTLACVQDGLALRRGELDAIGWSAGADADRRTEALVALLTAAGYGPDSPPLRILVESDAWHLPVGQALAQLGRTTVAVEPLAVPVAAPVDLLAPLRGGRVRAVARARARLRDWRWPAGLAAACLAVFLAGLNLHWARLSREQAELRAAVERGFRQAVPSATVVVDPVLQLQRHVADLRTRGGSSAADDFVPLLTRFARALGTAADDAIASFEYRDGVLRVRLRPGRADNDAAREALRAAAARAGLTVRFETGADPVAIVQVQS